MHPCPCRVRPAEATATNAYRCPTQSCGWNPFDAIIGELIAGRDVAIAGFGKLSVSERAAREGRNPATGQSIQIAASTAAKFSAAAALKKQLNT
jgi:nucleoid DNA-binding protein